MSRDCTLAMTVSSPPPASGHARDAAVLRRQGALPRRHPVLPDGRLLRDVLRGRADRGARPRADADVAIEGRRRQRHPDVRRPLPRRRRLHHAAGQARLPRRHLRPDRGSEAGQGRRQARGHPRRLARHADRRQLSRRARAGVHAGAAQPGTGDRLGVALLDASTGEFLAAEYDGADGRQALNEELGVLRPARDHRGAGRRGGVAAARDRAPRHRRRRRSTTGPSASIAPPRRCAISCGPAACTPSASTATRPRSAPPARWSNTCAIRRRSTSPTSAPSAGASGSDGLLIDPMTFRHLEVLEGAEGGRDGSLLSVLDRTQTVDGRAPAARLADAPADGARADPGSARRGRGVRVQGHRARPAARHAARRPRSRAPRRPGGDRHGRAARPGRAAPVARRDSARPARARADGGAARPAAWSASWTISPTSATRSPRRWSRSRRRWPATAA